MKSIKTAKAEIVLFTEDRIIILINNHVDLEKEDIIDINTVKYQLVGDKMHTVIFIPGKYNSLSVEAREHSASAAVNRNAIAKGIVAANIPNRMVTNFFIAVNRPPVPTKMFRTEKEAHEWLDKMTKKYLENKK